MVCQISDSGNKLHSPQSSHGRRSAIPILFPYEKPSLLVLLAIVVSCLLSKLSIGLREIDFVLIALVVVYDYFPNAQTLYEAHLKPKAPQFQNGRLQAQNVRLLERTLWSYIIQIAGAIKAVHDAGLAVRVIDVTKILVTSKNRFVLSCHVMFRKSMIDTANQKGSGSTVAASMTCSCLRQDKMCRYCNRKI